MEPYDLRRFLTGTPKKERVSDDTPILGAANQSEGNGAKEAEVPQPVSEKPEVSQAGKPEQQPAAQPEPQATEAYERDDYVAKAMHDLIIASGWVPTRTSPEANYYFYSYLPPSHKRSFQQARVYLSKLNLSRIITIEGLTIPAGIKDRMNIIIRMQKTGGIDRLRNSKTVTQILDVNNYFNQNSQLVNDEGLKAVLSSYLREAKIL